MNLKKILDSVLLLWWSKWWFNLLEILKKMFPFKIDKIWQQGYVVFVISFSVYTNRELSWTNVCNDSYKTILCKDFCCLIFYVGYFKVKMHFWIITYRTAEAGDFLLHFLKYFFPSKVDSFWIVGLDTMIGFLRNGLKM